jgi:hypothetical protein
MHGHVLMTHDIKGAEYAKMCSQNVQAFFILSPPP